MRIHSTPLNPVQNVLLRGACSACSQISMRASWISWSCDAVLTAQTGSFSKMEAQRSTVMAAQCSLASRPSAWPLHGAPSLLVESHAFSPTMPSGPLQDAGGKEGRCLSRTSRACNCKASTAAPASLSEHCSLNGAMLLAVADSCVSSKSWGVEVRTKWAFLALSACSAITPRAASWTARPCRSLQMPHLLQGKLTD